MSRSATEGKLLEPPVKCGRRFRHAGIDQRGRLRTEGPAQSAYQKTPSQRLPLSPTGGTWIPEAPGEGKGEGTFPDSGRGCNSSFIQTSTGAPATRAPTTSPDRGSEGPSPTRAPCPNKDPCCQGDSTCERDGPSPAPKRGGMSEPATRRPSPDVCNFAGDDRPKRETNPREMRIRRGGPGDQPPPILRCSRLKSLPRTRPRRPALPSKSMRERRPNFRPSRLYNPCPRTSLSEEYRS